MQTTEYKTSKKLKELGVKNEELIKYLGANLLTDPSAFTLDEILDMLPASLLAEDEWYHLVIEKEPFDPDKTEYKVVYEAADPYYQLACGEHENPAEAAGLLLAECIEKGYIKIGAKK